MPNVADDERFMDLALAQARRCLEWGDVPVGAVVVRGDDVVGAAGNEREHRGDPTAHAEILALRQAAERTGQWRMDGCTLFVTLEPCAMCAGAMVLARLDRLVFGATDPKAGFAGSLGDLVRDPRLNHRVAVTPGVRSEEGAALLRGFFTDRRSERPPVQASFVLIHSPLVGPMTWGPVAEDLTRRNVVVVVPSLAGAGAGRRTGPFWPEHARAVAHAVEAAGMDVPLVLVGHSGAGPLLPAIRSAVPNPVTGYVFVDAGLPVDGASRLDRFDPIEADAFRHRATGGFLPPWTEEDLREAIPGEADRARFAAELRPVPLALYEEELPVFEGWPDAPCAYLRFGTNPVYDDPADRAVALGWPSRRLDGDHFHMLVDPGAVTDALLDLASILIGPGRAGADL